MLYIRVVETIDYTYIGKLQEQLDRLTSKLKYIKQHRPLPAIALQKIKDALSIEWTFNSNGIEGNSLTLRETHIILKDGMTIGGKSMREHFEAFNHNNAVAYLEEKVNPNHKLTSSDILDLHSLILQNIDLEFAGRLRTAGVRINGANFTPPNALKVSNLLDDLIEATNSNLRGLHPIVLASVFHHRFVHIHPFFDGNGRTARLAMNILLLREGYPPAIILKNDRKKYYTALNEANKGKYFKITLLMIQALERSLNIYINAMPEYLPEYRLISDIVQEPDVPYGQEYVSLLARRGAIDAYKEGRNWLTTKEAVATYIKNKKRN